MPLEMDALATSALNTLLTVIVTGAVTWCVSTVRGIAKRSAEDRARDEARQEARDAGTLALLHIKLMDAYEAYVLDGRPLSYDRRQDIDRLYGAYHALGGNGTGTDIYRRICDVPITTFCPIPRAVGCTD